MSKPRDSKAILAKRNERARERGFTSYAQERRAKTEGYTDAGAYQATVEARHNPARSVVRAVTSGKLLGGAAMHSGAVFSADFTEDGHAETQWRMILRFRPDRRATISVETERGNVYHLGGEHGGYRLSYLRKLYERLGDWPAVVAYLLSVVKERSYKDRDESELDEPDEIVIVTVTVI